MKDVHKGKGKRIVDLEPRVVAIMICRSRVERERNSGGQDRTVCSLFYAGVSTDLQKGMAASLYLVCRWHRQCNKVTGYETP